MGIETERLKLLPHTIELDSDGRWLVKRESDGVRVAVPNGFQGFLKAVDSGLSLSQIAEQVLRTPGDGRFHRLGLFLGFLLDAGLLADKKAIRLAEAMRPDYAWPDSIAFSELWSFQLWRMPGGTPLPVSARDLVVGFLAVTGVAFTVASAVAMRPKPFPETSAGWPIFMAFVFAFFVGRSMRTAAQLLAVRTLSRFGPEIRIRLDAVSVSLATDEVAKARPDSKLVWAAAGALLWTASPVAVASVVGLPEVIRGFVPLFTGLLLLADLSPFRQSALTEWLRALYSAADRRAERERKVRPPLEEEIRTVQTAAFFVWGLGLGVFLMGPMERLFWFVRGGLDLSVTVTLASCIFLGVSLLVIFASFVDDMINMAQTKRADASEIRKLMRRKTKSVAVSDAVEKGLLPSRQEIEGLPFLRQFDKESREQILERAEILDLAEGDAACRQGATDRRLFVLLSGKVGVIKVNGPNRRRLVALLEPGSVFGEAGFFLGKPRSADVSAMEPSRVLAIPHTKGMATLDPSKSEELQARIWFLQALVSSELFKGLPSEALDAIVFSGTKRLFRGGERIISEGEAADACYFLVQGQASVVQNTKLINRVKAGDVFGEIALLKPDTYRTASVIADSESLAIQVEASRFWALLCSHLPLAIEIERVAERRLARDKQRAGK